MSAADSTAADRALEKIDQGVADLMRDCIGRALARKMPDLTDGQVLQIQDVVMDQLTRFGAQ